MNQERAARYVFHARAGARVPNALTLIVVATLFVTIAPTARAAETEGEVRAVGAVLLPDASRWSLDPIATYFHAPVDFEDFTLRASTLRVYRVEARSVSVRSPGVPGIIYETEKTVAIYDLHNVTMTIEGAAPRGWLGIYSRPGLSMNGHATDALEVRASAAGVVGNAPATPEPTPNPRLPYYAQAVSDDHLVFLAPTGFSLTGGAMLKFHGPIVLVNARENETRFETGSTTDAEPVGTRIERWVSFEFDAGELEVEASSPVSIAALTASMRWDGEARMNVADGEMRIDGDTERALTGPLAFTGAFTSGLAPARDGNQVTTRLRLNGDLTSSNIRTIPTPDGADASDGAYSQWMPLVLFAAVIASVGIGAGVLRKRRETNLIRAFSLEELIQFATLAGEGGRHQEAVEWLGRARRLAPKSARLALDEAFHLGASGNVTSALAIYEEARVLSGHGEADFLAAVLILGSSNDVDAAETHLVRALATTPALVSEIDGEMTFASLRGRPDFDRAIRRARRATEWL